MEMSWDWLLQIFRGVGEVVDVYVSHKRRIRNGCKFSFVRFKKIKEAKNAIRDLDGVKVRDRCMKVSFAKYNKKGLLWKNPNTGREEILSEPKEREDKSLSAMVNRRSFKDVVKGPLHNLREPEGNSKNLEIKEIPDVDMYKSETDKMLLKEIFWRLIEEVFSPNNKKELMRRLDEVIDGVMHENKLAKEAMGASNRGGNEAERQQMKRKEKMPGHFGKRIW